METLKCLSCNSLVTLPEDPIPEETKCPYCGSEVLAFVEDVWQSENAEDQTRSESDILRQLLQLPNGDEGIVEREKQAKSKRFITVFKVSTLALVILFLVTFDYGKATRHEYGSLIFFILTLSPLLGLAISIGYLEMIEPFVELFSYYIKRIVKGKPASEKILDELNAKASHCDNETHDANEIAEAAHQDPKDKNSFFQRSE